MQAPLLHVTEYVTKCAMYTLCLRELLAGGTDGQELGANAVDIRDEIVLRDVNERRGKLDDDVGVGVAHDRVHDLPRGRRVWRGWCAVVGRATLKARSHREGCAKSAIHRIARMARGALL